MLTGNGSLISRDQVPYVVTLSSELWGPSGLGGLLMIQDDGSVRDLGARRARRPHGSATKNDPDGDHKISIYSSTLR